MLGMIQNTVKSTSFSLSAITESGARAMSADPETEIKYTSKIQLLFLTKRSHESIPVSIIVHGPECSVLDFVENVREIADVLLDQIDEVLKLSFFS